MKSGDSKPEVVKELFKYATLSNPAVHKININQADLESLKKHPYIRYQQANVIINYRMQHGKFQKPEDLLKIKILSQDWLDKIQPYLAF